VIGVVLAEGGGLGAQPLTADPPIPLLQVREDTTILDLALGNLRAVDIVEVLLVVGNDGDRIARLVDRLEARHGVRITPVANGRAEPGTAHALYCARDAFAEGCLVVSGNAVHPVGVERALVDRHAGTGRIPLDRRAGTGRAGAGRPELLLAVAARGDRPAAGPDGRATGDGAGRDRQVGSGGFLGVSLVEPEAGPRLTEALRAVLERDPSGCYEDGYRQFVDGGGRVLAADVGDVEWARVGDHAALARARAIACRY
jgi:hypothetical protein